MNGDLQVIINTSFLNIGSLYNLFKLLSYRMDLTRTTSSASARRRHRVTSDSPLALIAIIHHVHLDLLNHASLINGLVSLLMQLHTHEAPRIVTVSGDFLKLNLTNAPTI